MNKCYFGINAGVLNDGLNEVLRIMRNDPDGIAGFIFDFIGSNLYVMRLFCRTPVVEIDIRENFPLENLFA